MKNVLLFIFMCLLIPVTLSCIESRNFLTGDRDKVIDTNEYKTGLLVLSNDSMEGRLPGTAGGIKAANYIASRFMDFGLTPVSTEHGYFQQVNIHSFHPDYSKMTINISGSGINEMIRPFDEILFVSKEAKTSVRVDGEMVFVGYGTVAPEYTWDDYKDIGVKDKIVVCLLNHPYFRTPGYTKGQTTYYGSFNYRSEVAFRKGARAILFIFQKDGIFQFSGWQTFIKNYSFGDYDLDSKIPIKAFITEESFNRAIKGKNLTMTELVKMADDPDFQPFSLKLNLHAEYDQENKDFISPNVVGYIKGTHFPNEAVVFMSHYDHLGINNPINGDSIFNGAIDNASGTAGVISLAKYFSSHPAKRSIIFLATTAEEMSFQGALHYVNNPVIPLDRTIVGVNLDMLNFMGKTDSIELNPLPYIDAVSFVKEVTDKNHIELKLSNTDSTYYNFRVESYPFALYDVAVMTIEFSQVGPKPSSLSVEEYEAILNDGGINYHLPADEVKPWFRYDGILQQLELAKEIGAYYANDGVKPTFNKENPFKPARNMWVRD